MSHLDDVYLLQPLSVAPAKEADVKLSEALESYLKSQNLYESYDEAVKRELVLVELNGVVKQWIQKVCISKGYFDDFLESANANIHTFGSYRLGVHGPGADMDILCVGPRYATREKDFFGPDKHTLESLLRAHPKVADLTPVPEAYVPLISLQMDGIALDILYGRLQSNYVPLDLDLSSPDVLRGCDEQTVRSLNGCRVTDTILNLVPDILVFRLALRALKLWAARRGVYSNVLGYLGGVNLAILVAKTCQWHPRASASTIVWKLFRIFAHWPWPRAVHLRHVEDYSLNLQPWNPVPGSRDASALMPVITPSYPAMNSLYNVRKSTLDVMREEMDHAMKICEKIVVEGTADWSKLFEAVDFFEAHASYIQVSISAKTPADLVPWDGWVNSRLRHLVEKIEGLVIARPLPTPQKDPNPASDGRARSNYFVGVRKKPNMPPVNLQQPIKHFVDEVLAWKTKAVGMEMRVVMLKKKELPGWLFPSGFNKFNPEAVATEKARRASEAAAVAAIERKDFENVQEKEGEGWDEGKKVDEGVEQKEIDETGGKNAVKDESGVEEKLHWVGIKKEREENEGAKEDQVMPSVKRVKKEEPLEGVKVEIKTETKEEKVHMLQGDFNGNVGVESVLPKEEVL
eukprot:CAMPEP_0175081864 /NCGR_PEP_ID=MMETSP0052_2-20121109/26411_1 /TAXON_ID=51329 ORGANISM="Polytomella parva, Strain SAG 63-3" /NCGR_SAMPLE_ID=MMETSP0052_2 /ASSEMBLY_ACC=CAM_ASM_000194 /LENGTH=630 /DNA_ID=CAMNT_0016352945 /DNA_START=20 /DNA_END=1912 /DNA_ORIENTATION=-